jgi:hypothetical protein
MRLAFFILLLANALLFVWGQGYWDRNTDGREPERLQRQIDPEKLHIVAPAAAASVAVAAPQAAACKRIEWLSADEATTLANTLAAIPDWQVARIPRPEGPAHWVVIQELPSRALAEKKKAELRQLSVDEGEIVEDASLGPYAVSLGVFRSQSLAEDYLQSIVRKGVRSARLAKRELPPERFALELRAPAEALDNKLPELVAPLTGANLVSCATL